MKVKNPASPADMAVYRHRAQLLNRLRNFFAEQHVLEVTTPLVSPAANPDPAVEPVQMAGTHGGYLRTSPEFAMKRLLADGVGDIYELGPVFRAGESGKTHSPQFTMLEWYRQHWTYHQLMSEVATLIRYVGAGKFDDWPLRIISYAELFREYAGIDPHTADIREIAALCMLADSEAGRMLRNDYLDLVLTTIIQPTLPAQSFTFVHEYPADQAALARIRATSPAVAERFELFIGSMELANGYQELTDPEEHRRRFNSDNERRRECGLTELPLDHAFLAAIDRGLPECAGVALGVDRLLMVIHGIRDISQVL